MSELKMAQEQEKRRLDIRSLVRTLGMLPVLIVLAAGFQLISGKFLSRQQPLDRHRSRPRSTSCWPPA